MELTSFKVDRHFCMNAAFCDAGVDTITEKERGLSKVYLSEWRERNVAVSALFIQIAHLIKLNPYQKDLVRLQRTLNESEKDH